MRSPRFALSLAVLIVLWQSHNAFACTGIRLISHDGSIVYARTLEFGQELPPVLIAIPRGASTTAIGMNSKPGLAWKASHAALGMGAKGYDGMIVDGLNDAGLGVGIFYHPGYAKYAAADAADQSKIISAIQLPTFFLNTCPNVAAVLKALDGVVVAPVPFPDFKGPPPVHLIVHDLTGRSVVIEFIEGKTKVHENPVGVITNAPTFDWHLTNLRNYINLSPKNAPPLMIGKAQFPQFGEGSGMHGLPGDFTPPSRFVRAAALSQAAKTAADGVEAVNTAFHILDNFDIVQGSVRGEEAGKVTFDYTQWTSAADLKNGRYYYRTYENPQIRVIDLQKLRFEGPGVLSRPIDDKVPVFVDETSKLVK